MTIQTTQTQEGEEDRRIPTQMTLTIQTTQPQDRRIPTQMTLTTNERIYFQQKEAELEALRPMMEEN